ncbi:MAG: DUF2059 domain-containing protein [Bacteroidales bacterium]|nr:DUF2059 domain-containing protein [Bacteroidales bacterium]
MKKVIIFIGMMLLAAIGTVNAQDAALTAEIKKSLELQNMRGAMIETLSSQYQPAIDNGQLKVDDLKALTSEIADYVMSLLEEQLFKFYAENYTLEEMKELNKFYASPLGQKNIRLTPALTVMTNKAATSPEFMSKVQEIMLKHMQQ